MMLKNTINSDKDSNDSKNQSWRQSNKGFSRNNDRYNTDNNKFRDNRNKSDWNKDNSGGSDNWNNSGASQNNMDWNADKPDSSFNRNSKDGQRTGGGGGFKKKTEFKRDGSEISSSGSEKSFQKGLRTNSRSDRNDRPRNSNKHDRSKNNSLNTADESWSASSVTSQIDAAPFTATFTNYDLIGTESKVLICWFHNPAHFYCQLADVQDQFKAMMEDIQQTYKKRKTEQVVVGAPVIGLFPEDNVLYRAVVLEVVGTQFKVYYVDFGNVSIISKVWRIEKKFMTLPAQAICCGLHLIAPNGESWPTANNFSKYFDKESFTCHFIAKHNEQMSVKLFSGSDDIQQMLIDDGLVASIKSEPDVEIPLLAGQQFRAVLKSVNNLSDLIISLECGLFLSCQIHNLDTATETFPDNLKEFLENIVIVYVDNVIDDRLEVTLYDTEGNKIVIVNPDEGAFDTVETICPLLILHSEIRGYVSHTSESSLFIQPVEYAATIPYLLEQLFAYYENVILESPIIPEEGLLYAVRSQDGNWYRARVTSFDDENATVCYIDYGNTESVSFVELRELSTSFMEISTLCVQVAIEGPSEQFSDKDVVAHIYYGESGWEGSVAEELPYNEAPKDEQPPEDPQNVIYEQPAAEEPQNVIYEQPAAEDSQNVIYEQPTAEYAQPVAEEAMVEHLQTTAEAPQETLPAEFVPAESSTVVDSTIQGTAVIMSHIDSPSDFYLQLNQALNSLDELQLQLQDLVIECPVLENPTAGILCAAPYSGDQMWYRAQILDAGDGVISYRFVDYGNTDSIVDNETTQIKTLPPHLLSLEVYATRSSLKIKPTDEEWSIAAIERFRELSSNEVTAQFVDQDEKTNYVELYTNDGQNIREILIAENLALPNELVVESKSTCFVSHLNSPSEFWIQLENCIDELETVADKLRDAENFPGLDDLSPGTLCAALFPDDEMWYRARILSNTVAGVKLLFIDYGNSCMSSNLRQLPEDLVVTLAPLAQKCSLQKPPGLTYWTPQAIDKFNEISDDGRTIFTHRKVGTGETTVVELLLNGEDVALQLLPITEDGYVKNVDSLDKFSVEINGVILPEVCKLETLPGLVWNEESVKKFEELNNKGDTLFQIEKTASEGTVRLYLDGKDIRPDLGGTKAVSLNVSNSNSNSNETDNQEEVVDDLSTKIENVIVNEVDKNLDVQSIDDVENYSVDPKTNSESDNHVVVQNSELVSQLDKSNVENSTIVTNDETKLIETMEDHQENCDDVGSVVLPSTLHQDVSSPLKVENQDDVTPGANKITTANSDLLDEDNVISEQLPADMGLDSQELKEPDSLNNEGDVQTIIEEAPLIAVSITSEQSKIDGISNEDSREDLESKPDFIETEHVFEIESESGEQFEDVPSDLNVVSIAHEQSKTVERNVDSINIEDSKKDLESKPDLVETDSVLEIESKSGNQFEDTPSDLNVVSIAQEQSKTVEINVDAVNIEDSKEDLDSKPDLVKMEDVRKIESKSGEQLEDAPSDLTDISTTREQIKVDEINVGAVNIEDPQYSKDELNSKSDLVKTEHVLQIESKFGKQFEDAPSDLNVVSIAHEQSKTVDINVDAVNIEDSKENLDSKPDLVKMEDVLEIESKSGEQLEDGPSDLTVTSITREQIKVDEINVDAVNIKDPQYNKDELNSKSDLVKTEHVLQIKSKFGKQYENAPSDLGIINNADTGGHFLNEEEKSCGSKVVLSLEDNSKKDGDEDRTSETSSTVLVTDALLEITNSTSLIVSEEQYKSDIISELDKVEESQLCDSDNNEKISNLTDTLVLLENPINAEVSSLLTEIIENALDSKENMELDKILKDDKVTSLSGGN